MKPVILALALVLLLSGERCQSSDAFQFFAQQPHGETGNMHYSEVLKLQLGDSIPVVLKTNIEEDILAPSDVLLVRPIDKHAVIVFAYSSEGGGSETLHAILLSHVGKRSVMTDHLQMDIRRGCGGFAWSKRGELLVVEPTEKLDDDDLFLKNARTAFTYREINAFKFTSCPPPANLIPGLFGEMGPLSDPMNLRVARIPISHGHFDLN